MEQRHFIKRYYYFIICHRTILHQQYNEYVKNTVVSIVGYFNYSLCFKTSTRTTATEEQGRRREERTHNVP